MSRFLCGFAGRIPTPVNFHLQRTGSQRFFQTSSRSSHSIPSRLSFFDGLRVKPSLPPSSTTKAPVFNGSSSILQQLRSSWVLRIQQVGRTRPPSARGRSGTSGNWQQGSGSGGGGRRSFLQFLDKIPEDYVFWGILGVNGTVFALWWWAQNEYVS